MKWIKASEPPTGGTNVICRKDNGSVLELRYQNYRYEWRQGNGKWLDQTSQVTHWMPMPEFLDETPFPEKIVVPVGDVSEEEIEKLAEKVRKEMESIAILCYDEREENIFDTAFIAGYKSSAPQTVSEATAAEGFVYVKPKVVCFCGSTRFAETFMVERWLLEKQGIITFGINILPNNYFVEGNSHGAEQEGVKEILDELHKRKIDLSDEVVILNIGGYIGESTRAELEYALQIGKPVKYFEPIK